MDKSKNILITGGTGFVGGYLCEELMRRGHYLTILTRSPEKYSEQGSKNLVFKSWDDPLVPLMEESEIVINLAGENLFGQRWTEPVKKKLYNSRIITTSKLVKAMKQATVRPELFISASAVGIYGDRGDQLLDESSKPGDDFLAEICSDWEAESHKAKKLGVRVVNPRIGIVLEDNGGVVEKMKLPFSLFAGGPLGDGKQYVPWIHMADLCNALIYPIENLELEGPYNASAPVPETMNELARVMGKVMNRPAFFRVPEFMLKLVLGEAAQPVLSSLRVQPKVLQVTGFEFEFEDLEEALADIL